MRGVPSVAAHHFKVLGYMLLLHCRDFSIDIPRLCLPLVAPCSQRLMGGRHEGVVCYALAAGVVCGHTSVICTAARATFRVDSTCTMCASDLLRQPSSIRLPNDPIPLMCLQRIVQHRSTAAGQRSKHVYVSCVHQPAASPVLHCNELQPYDSASSQL